MKILILFILLGLVLIGTWILIIKISEVGSKLDNAIDQTGHMIDKEGNR